MACYIAGARYNSLRQSSVRRFGILNYWTSRTDFLGKVKGDAYPDVEVATPVGR